MDIDEDFHVDDVADAYSPNASAIADELAYYGYVPNAEDTLKYVVAVGRALRSGVNVTLYLTSICPQCDRIPSRPDDYAHIVIAGHVVVGCIGLFVIPPSAVGITVLHWTDWTETTPGR